MWRTIPDDAWISGQPSTIDLISPFEGQMEGLDFKEWTCMKPNMDNVQENFLPRKFKPLSMQHGEKQADIAVEQAAKERAAVKATENKKDDVSEIVPVNITPSGNLLPYGETSPTQIAGKNFGESSHSGKA